MRLLYICYELPTEATPTGENRDFMNDWPGVFLTSPTEVPAMESVILDLATQKQSGQLPTFDRSARSSELSYHWLAEHFCQVIIKACNNKSALQKATDLNLGP